MNKPLTVANKPFKSMKMNTSKERSFYTQGQRFAARVLFILWLLASGSPEGALAAPKHQMTPATTTSPGDPSLASIPPLPGGILPFPPESPGSFWDNSVASSPALERALQQRMSQEATPDEECNLLRTSPKVSTIGENLSFQARGGESVHFYYQMGQWRAEVSSRIGAFSRRAVLPVVCSHGTDVTSSLEVLSKYPSWQRQRQIHVLDRNVCPTLGEVVYVGELGLKGGGQEQSSARGNSGDPLSSESQLLPAASIIQQEVDAPIPTSAQPLTPQEGGDTQSLVDQLKTLASDPQIDQQPDKLAELGTVLLELATSKQEEAETSPQDLSLYTDAAILYQHVLSICAQEDAQKKKILDSEKAKELADSAYQGLAQIEISMLAQATGAEAGAITPSKPLPARIAEDKQWLEAMRTKAREEVARLAEFRDKQGSSEEVLAAEEVYIEGSKKLFAEIAENIKSLLAKFYQESEAALGPAPCKYAVMGLGSLALQQTTPYSDLEFVILMEDAPDEDTAKAWREYLRKLTHLVHFRVINLGETVLPFSEYKISLDHLGRRDLHFDLGGTTLLGRKDKDYELIQPVTKMAEYMQNEGGKMEQMDKLLPYILERTCYIYGDQKLHDSYRAAQDQFWSCQDAAGKRAYQERMMKVLLKGITELDHSQPGVVKKGREQAGNLRTVGPKLDPGDAGKLYDVKQEIYRLPDRLIYGLAMYFGICPESAWDAVEQLKAQDIIGVSEEAKQAAHRLQYAVSFATMLRLATYLRYGQQNETLAGNASRATTEHTVSTIFALPEEAFQENGSLFKYYYTALALHSEMHGFFKMLHLRSQIQSDRHLHRMLSGFGPGGKYTASKERAYFCSSGFYDTSCAAKIAIYNRLLHYEQAAKCAEDHLKKVKAGYNKKKLARTHHNLGVSYYHLGKFAQSFDNFRDSLKLLEALYPDGDPQVAAVLRSLGIAHYNLSEFQESLEYFEQSLEMLQRLYQEKHPEIAQALGSVGAAHEQLESFEESLEHKQQALEMLQALYPDKNPEVARARLSLGDTYAAMGQLAASLEHKQEALEMLQALYGSSHPEVARALLSLGESYALSGRLAASLEHKQKALEILRVFYRAVHPEVTQASLSLNATYRLTQGAKASRQLSGHSLRPLRTAHPQHLALLFTPKHGKEAAGENTLLRDYYSKTDFPYVKALFDEQRSKHVKDLECQLMLLEQKVVGQDTDKAGGEAPENHIAKHHERRFEWVKTPLGSADLFKKRSVRPGDPEKEISRILLIGDPGTGKTTLSRQLAYQWAKGAWGQEFHTLYLLPVRSLQQSEYDGMRYNREKTLATAIVNNCFAHELPSTEAEYNRLRDHIEEELEKSTTLVILDGLDERAGACKEILSQAQSGAHKLLMLSRPYGIETERRTVDIEIEHVGFNRAQLEAYIQAEVSDGERASELLGYIDKHENIRSIAHIPVNLQILCALWQDEGYDVREVAQQGSLPGIYRLVTEYTWHRYKKRASAFVSVQGSDELFNTLGKVALQALEKGTVLISPRLIDKILEDDMVAQVAQQAFKDADFLLLQYVGEDAGRQRGFYEFPHLTFQEYFAGRALARQFLSEDEYEQERTSEFVSEHKYESQYARTLSFMAGEVSRVRGVQGIKELLRLLGERKEVAGLQHLLLQLRVVHEWLCIASDQEAARGMAVLEELDVLASLQDWFSRGIALAKTGYATAEQEAGKQLLQILVQGVSRTGAVLAHVPSMLTPLHQAVKNEDSIVREAAVNALGHLMIENPATLTFLQQAGKDENSFVRIAALEALLALSATDPATLIFLQQAAKGEDSSVREVVVKALDKLNISDPAILALLYQFVEDQDKNVRQSAISTLGNLRTSDPAMLQTLRNAATQDPDSDVRKTALEALMQAAPGDVATLRVLERLTAQDEDKNVHRAAINALGNLKTDDPATLALLQQAAKNEDKNVRKTAVKTLGNLKILDPATKELLDQAATDPDSDVRQAAVETLARTGHDDPDMLKILSNVATQDSDSKVRQTALTTLTQVAPSHPATMEALEETITKASDSIVRSHAISVLVQLWQAAPSEIDAHPQGLQVLLKATEDPDIPVRRTAMRALVQVAPSAPETKEILRRTKHGDVRNEALKAIVELIKVTVSKSSLESLNFLVNAVIDEDPEIRRVALETLGDIKIKSPQLREFIAETLKKQIEATQDTEQNLALTIKALVQVAPGAPETLQILLDATKEESERPEVRIAAISALQEAAIPNPEIREAFKAIVIKITKVLTDTAYKPDKDRNKHKNADLAAIDAFGKLARASTDIITTLINVLAVAQDSAWEFRNHAHEALSEVVGRIQARPPDPAALTALQEAAVQHSNKYVRQGALQALAHVLRIHPRNSPDDIHQILEQVATKDRDADIRCAAVSALKIVPNDPRTITTLVRAALDSDIDVRREAVKVLVATITSIPTEQIDHLTHVATSGEDTYRPYAIEALAKLLNAMPSKHPSILQALYHITQDDKDSNVRLAAIKALRQVTADDATTLEVLRKAVQDEDSNVRIEAIKALSQVKADDATTPGILRKAVQDEDSNVRLAAIQALARIRPGAAATLEVLRKAAQDQDSGVRREAIKALVQVKASDTATLEVLRKAAQDQDSGVRREAIKALIQVKASDTDTLEVLRKAAQDEDSGVRRAAFDALIDATPPTQKTMQTLLYAANTKDIDLQVRNRLIEKLARIVKGNPEVLPILQNATRHDAVEICCLAIDAMKAVSSENPELKVQIVQTLLEATKALEPHVRLTATSALRSVAPDGHTDLIPTLQNIIIQDGSWEVRQEAVEALAPQAPETLKILQETAEKPDEQAYVRIAAIEGLVAVHKKSPASTSPIQAILQNLAQDLYDPEVGTAATRALKEIAPEDLEIIRSLLNSFKDSDPNIATIKSIERLLEKITPGDSARLQRLVNFAKHEATNVRLAAVEALTQVASADPRALQAPLEVAARQEPLQTFLLRISAQDPDQDVRQVASKTIERLVAADPQALTHLRKATKDQDSDVRQAAVSALGKRQPLDASSLTLLLKATKDQDEHVRKTAVEVLDKIPTEQHIDSYWATKDEQLIPHIAYRLYKTPLVIDQGKATLYLPSGQHKTWEQPAADLQRFVALIKYEANQTTQGLRNYYKDPTFACVLSLF